MGATTVTTAPADRPGTDGSAVPPAAAVGGRRGAVVPAAVPDAPAAAAAARTGGPAGEGALAPAQGVNPAVDWPNRSYPDPAGGPPIALRDGRSAGAGPQVALSTVLPARYKGRRPAWWCCAARRARCRPTWSSSSASTGTRPCRSQRGPRPRTRRRRPPGGSTAARWSARSAAARRARPRPPATRCGRTGPSRSPGPAPPR
ncbi:hypothetical protein ACFQ0M_13025 [Kitasatospora aburaviensis]